MKNQILDDNFNDELRNRLGEDEKVIWEWKPPISRRVILSIVASLIQVPFIILYFKHDGITPAIILTFLVIIVSYFYQYRQTIASVKNKRYLITNQRIIFQTNQNKQLTYYAIPFEDISYPSVYPDFWGNRGVILLNLKKDANSRNLPQIKELQEIGDGRPVLAEIDNVKEVGKYIKMGINKKI